MNINEDPTVTDNMFYAMLQASDTVESTDSAMATDVMATDTVQICHITNQPCSRNAISLVCGHTFEYTAIFSEWTNQKKLKYLHAFKSKNAIPHERICPYCRVANTEVLPFRKIKNICRVHGVNSPAKYEMKTPMKCGIVYKSGPNKGHICGQNAYYNEDGPSELVDMLYCVKHHGLELTKYNKTLAKMNSIKNDGTDSMSATI